MSDWDWIPPRAQGVWRHGAAWMRPLVAVSPWLTVALLLLMMQMLGGTLTGSRGVLFDLPGGELAEGEATGLVALVLPTEHETLVFFDDSRYLLTDSASAASLGDHLAESVRRSGDTTLLALADRRVPCGELMRLTEIARKSGLDKVLFAEKKAVDAE